MKVDFPEEQNLASANEFFNRIDPERTFVLSKSGLSNVELTGLHGLIA